MKIRTLVMAAFIGTSVCASVASGGAPMGPPTAFLGGGHWGIGGEYGYERMNVTAAGTVTESISGHPSAPWAQIFRIDDLTGNMFFGTVAYGLGDTWDIFARVGAANAKGTIVALPASPSALERQDDFDGGFGLAWGAGTRATFLQTGPWSFGGLVQFTWFNPGDSDFTVADPVLPPQSWVGNVTLNYWQVQAALAAVYQVDCLRFWAGPFLQFVQGDMDFSGSGVLDDINLSTISWSSSLEDSFQIGGHVGVDWRLADEWDLWVEGQITGDSWLVGVGGVFVPGREKTFDR